VIARYKHSSLFGLIVSKRGNKFYIIDSRKLQRQLRDLKEDLANAQQRETEAEAKRHELEKQLVKQHLHKR
jgi:hypothetical protein